MDSPIPETELRLAASRGLDSMDNQEIIDLMLAEENNVIAAIAKAKPQICRVIDCIVQRFRRGGKLFYVGAGTSGRLGVLDASECPPTFSVPPKMVQGIIAGGKRALYQAMEGVEDNAESGAEVIRQRKVGENDVVIGIASSGRTPFVLGSLRQAHVNGAFTVLLTCAAIPTPQQTPYIDEFIRAIVGAEILSGSTRLKAGTATKLILNMLSTISMVRLGKVYDNLMVDLHASNQKLRKRAMRIFSEIEQQDLQRAEHFLEKAHWELKTAIVMSRYNLDYGAARNRLAQVDGELARALTPTRENYKDCSHEGTYDG